MRSFVKHLIYSCFVSSFVAGKMPRNERHGSRRSIIDEEQKPQKPLLSSMGPDRLWELHVLIFKGTVRTFHGNETAGERVASNTVKKAWI
jgi:hypothetical protein